MAAALPSVFAGMLASRAVTISPGQTFARYTIEALLGQGGMGEVYRAYDTTLRRRVALKVIHPDLAIPDAAARLEREARAAAALAHPNTVAIHDLGQVDGVVYLVMELVSGVPLRAYVGDTKVPVTRKLRWLVDVARGLAAAHRAKLVHRDVKPTNVMVSDEGIVKVLDFGLAKPVEGASARTDVGLVVGTPRYMAPELFSGLPADPRSDQYAFGVTAYELLAGVHPGGPTGALPAALDSVVPEVGAAAARVLGKTLARERGDRFASMDEVVAALEEALGEETPKGSPATRREGGTALALAPTELSPSAPNKLEPSAALAPLAPLAPSLGPPAPARGPSVAGILAVLGLLAFAGVYVATRLFGETPPAAATTIADAAVASSELEASTTAIAVPPVVDAGTVRVEETEDASAVVAVPEAGPDPGTRLFVDDFEDPWLKTRPRDAQ